MANLITIGRLLLLFATIGLIYTRSHTWLLISILLLIVVFLSDALDGYVARRFGTTTEFGAVLDIAGDRVVENALWIVFAHLGLIGVWAPLVVMARGFLVDATRGVGYAAGKSAFGDNTMMRSPVTRFLVASRFMRGFYGLAKAAGFVFLTAVLAADARPGGATDQIVSSWPVWFSGWFMVYSALALTVIRGVPVVIDAIYYIREQREGTVAP